MTEAADSKIEEDVELCEKIDISDDSFQFKAPEKETSIPVAPAVEGENITTPVRYSSNTVTDTRSVHSTQSRVSISPYQITTTYAAQKLFSYKAGMIDNAVEVCKKSVIEPEVDGDVKGVWLLIDIDHWDHEREKLVVLTENSLLAVKFDFITPSVRYFKRILLKNVKSVEIGDLVYPDFSLMGARENGGLRIHWANEDAWFYQRWNPWCDDVGYITFTHHLLIHNEKERETATYNVSDFADSVVQAVNTIRQKNGGGEEGEESVPVKEGPLIIYSYASVTSLIYNQSHIGFNMDRGGVTY